MLGFSPFLFYFLFFLDLSLASTSHTLVPRALQKLHRNVARQTHSLANDLRVAFRSVLLPRAESNQHVIYCKSGNQAVFNNGNDAGTPPATGSTTTDSGSSSLNSSTSTRRPTGSVSSSAAGGSSPTSSPNLPSSPWRLVNSYQGNNFFNDWDFFTTTPTSGDPTHGIVDYVDENTARSNNLLEVNSQGNAVMRVETTPNVSGNRKSVRISTKAQFNGGLFIMDAVHMPTGCGIWPAFWTNGPNWPFTGEIDIVEGVHDYTNNQATIHTDVGCTLASSSPNTLAISGTIVGGTNCAALTTGNQGCGIRASTSNSFGAGFNANGGGTYAMRWDANGVAVYFFPRGSEPSDITAGVPQPDSWGTAQARWPAASCDPFKFFSNHNAIFDTTLCGDWAGGVWNAAGIPGQDQSCAQRTGISTCEAFVRSSGSAMQEAYWEVSSVKIYQTQ